MKSDYQIRAVTRLEAVTCSSRPSARPPVRIDRDEELLVGGVPGGAVDPPGRLPLTFPASARQTPVAASPAQYPGIDGAVHYTEGLDIGYRWYLASGVKPLFPFGFGLSCTSFALSDPSVAVRGEKAVVGVTVANTGRRRGTDVVEAYVSFRPGPARPGPAPASRPSSSGPSPPSAFARGRRAR